MSAVVRTRRFRKLPASTPALWVVLSLAVLFFLLRYGQEVLLEHELNSKIAIQRQANAALRDENARLEAGLQYYQSDKYIEQRAREDLNLRRADEEVLIPVGVGAADEPSGESTLPGTKTSELSTPVPRTRSNLEKWFDLFMPFGGSP